MMYINICFMARVRQLRRRIGVNFMKMIFVDVGYQLIGTAYMTNMRMELK